MMNYVTLHIWRSTREKLKKLSALEGKTLCRLLDDMANDALAEKEKPRRGVYSPPMLIDQVLGDLQ